MRKSLRKMHVRTHYFVNYIDEIKLCGRIRSTLEFIGTFMSFAAQVDFASHDRPHNSPPSFSIDKRTAIISGFTGLRIDHNVSIADAWVAMWATTAISGKSITRHLSCGGVS